MFFNHGIRALGHELQLETAFEMGTLSLRLGLCRILQLSQSEDRKLGSGAKI